MKPNLLCALLLGGSLLFAAQGQSQTSASLSQEGWYADPEIRVFAGEYWVYPTSSKPGAGMGTEFSPLQAKLRGNHVWDKQYLSQTSMDAFSSPDLVHWTKHPHVLEVKDVPWAAYALWAPSAVHVNGKYHVFFAANDIQKDQQGPGGIGVAVSDSPGGPFVDAIGKPLIGQFYNGAQPIDPMVYQDENGAIYLYYGGQGRCNVVQLATDLKSVVPLQDTGMFKDITPVDYVEGPFMIKREGVYYFMWSVGNWTDSTYGVRYAKGSSPTGPFTGGGKILQTDPAIANGPGHHSVVQVPGTDEWYIVYHRHPLGTTGGSERVMAIDRMRFDAHGDIETVVMTKDGVASRPLTVGANRR